MQIILVSKKIDVIYPLDLNFFPTIEIRFENAIYQ